MIPTAGTVGTIGIVLLVVLFLASAIRILNEYERGVIFRLGRVIHPKGPGLIILIPVVDKMVKVSLRLVTMDVDPQDVITRDITDSAEVAEALAKAIEQLRDDPAMRRTLGEAARLFAASEFDSKQYYQKLIPIYQDAIKTKQADAS